NAGPRICLGQQFAYHEATFFLVRLLQQFTGFTLDEETNVAPPKEWAFENVGTRKSMEKIHPMSHLTMYVKVRFELISSYLFIDLFSEGRVMDSDEGAPARGH